ncbi:LacI family DNA-binding transcriptional regulator [Jeotgalibacillus proteolyticus]|uniref:LacI family transcriptional regulator n=1 Tax=Jeotgalibacillus proteolyticus TaxID=2082395 RepID=A0A2S5GBJ3_9BACL|nr:LacI family DNA-binding transcriptional regulator [Jeotgalibacillus proteolyticus]PPA70328.1 LacI family transcriptional regulator [Jeotgalibacillus proteolyticus]
MTTINDIAKMANVSRTTVSRVLNNKGYVSEDVRDRILKLVKETGYTPSLSAKSLRTKKSGVIGVILPKISTETASRVVSGINEVVSKEDYQILLTDTELNKEKEIEFIRLLKSRQVDGIILLATNINEDLTQAIQTADLPFISIGQDLPGVTSILYDDYHAAADVTNMMISHQHKKIAYIGVGEQDPSVGGLRKEGYLDTMAKNELPIHNEWIQEGDFSIESGYECAKKIIKNSASNLPTAIFCVTDRMAIGAMEYLREQGFSIPKDIAIAGIGASTLSKYVTPALTTVDYFNKHAGEKAAQLLLAQMKKKKPKEKFVQSYRLIKRDSV